MSRGSHPRALQIARLIHRVPAAEPVAEGARQLFRKASSGRLDATFDPRTDRVCWPSRRARSRPTRGSAASSREVTPSPNTTTTGSRTTRTSGSGTPPGPHSANSPVRRLRTSFYPSLPPKSSAPSRAARVVIGRLCYQWNQWVSINLLP